ncbi:hypothetical protein NSK_006168, partial [Nannochloropsis salina CCMP1776]
MSNNSSSIINNSSSSTTNSTTHRQGTPIILPPPSRILASPLTLSTHTRACTPFLPRLPTTCTRMLGTITPPNPTPESEGEDS